MVRCSLCVVDCLLTSVCLCACVGYWLAFDECLWLFVVRHVLLTACCVSFVGGLMFGLCLLVGVLCCCCCSLSVFVRGCPLLYVVCGLMCVACGVSFVRSVLFIAVLSIVLLTCCALFGVWYVVVCE